MRRLTAVVAFRSDFRLRARTLGREERGLNNTKQGPILTNLTSLGVDGEGAAALQATSGYDNATGVGSPNRYIESYAP